MSKALPFTENSIKRAIKGVEKAGLYVVGIRPDGTIIVSTDPIEAADFIPADTAQESKWANFRA